MLSELAGLKLAVAALSWILEIGETVLTDLGASERVGCAVGFDANPIAERTGFTSKG